MPLHPKPLHPFIGSPIYFQGPPLHLGKKPAIFYFALSGHATLYADPFNQPVLKIIESGIRVYSWDLPFHDKEAHPKEAIRRLIHEFLINPSSLEDFLCLCKNNIDYLINEGLADPEAMGVAGLSRGGFIASHLASKEARIKAVVGFAPLTVITAREDDKIEGQAGTILLSDIVHDLTNARLRFYMGNHDTLVGTDNCYQFIRLLTESATLKGIRSPPVELILYPSIGHKGHGTPHHIFADGAEWLIDLLRN